MTVKSGFFSDGSSYNQADFNAFLVDSGGTGYVLGYENELRVTPNTPANMGVFVRPGRCYVQGYYGWVTNNEALTVPTAHTTKPRIDRVVARLSVSVNQSVTFAVLAGTPATNPSAPALTRTSETYEISLARIAVGAGVTSIGAGDITDERGDVTVCGVAGVKHSWQYLNNVAIDVSGMSVDTGVSDRDPVYFNGTKWVVATKGAVGFYDEANAAVITSGYLDGFTGLTPGAIVDNRGVALTATEIVVLESPVDSSGVKHVGDITGNLTGDVTGHLLREGYVGPAIGTTGILLYTFPASANFEVTNSSGSHQFNIDTSKFTLDTGIINDLYRISSIDLDASGTFLMTVTSQPAYDNGTSHNITDVWTSYDANNNVIDTKTLTLVNAYHSAPLTANLNITGATKIICVYNHTGTPALNHDYIWTSAMPVYVFKTGAV